MSHKFESLHVNADYQRPYCACGWVGEESLYRFERRRQFFAHLEAIKEKKQ